MNADQNENATPTRPPFHAWQHLDDEILAAYNAGALSPAEQDAAERHLGGCAACRQALAEVQKINMLLGGLAPQMNQQAAFGDTSLAESVLKQLAEPQPAESAFDAAALLPPSDVEPPSARAIRPLFPQTGVVWPEADQQPHHEEADWSLTRQPPVSMNGKGRTPPMRTIEPGFPDDSNASFSRPPQPRRSGGWRTLAAVAAVAALILVSAGVFEVLSHGRSGSTVGSGGTSTATTAPAPFSVTSVSLSVAPSSISGKTCGSSATFTYTAVFHIPAQTAGGTIHFSYTLNNGRSQTPGTVTVNAGETSKTFTFTSSGTLPADHTYPGIAIVMVTSPNNVLSPSVQPSGTCTVGSGAFQVTSVSMAINPTSVAGLACGSAFTETYTATFTLAPNGPGGTIQFEWTNDNGRGSNPASITVAPGQTTATYSFTWSGNLPPDHTAPEGGGIIVRSPNAINSPLLGPSGKCS